MQRCNEFLISGIALTAGAPLCISWFGLVGFYFGACHWSLRLLFRG